MEERNMIVNILTKTFVVSPYIKATKNPGSFKIIDIDCRNDSQDIIEYFTDIQNMVFSQASVPSFVLLRPTGNNKLMDFFQILRDYASMLGLNKKMYNTWIDQYNKFKSIWDKILIFDENYHDITNIDLDLDDVLSDKEIPESLARDIPVEYFLNNIADCDMARKKLANFAAYDLQYDIAQFILELYNRKDLSDECKNKYDTFMENFSTIYSSGKRFDEMILQDRENTEQIIELAYKSIGSSIDFSLYDDLEKYKRTYTNRGYSSLGLFKYNHFLEDEVLESGYKLKIRK